MEGEGEAANHKLRVLLQWNLCAIKAVTYLHTVLKKNVFAQHLTTTVQRE